MLRRRCRRERFGRFDDPERGSGELSLRFAAALAHFSTGKMLVFLRKYQKPNRGKD
jgi:hypothetical protein